MTRTTTFSLSYPRNVIKRSLLKAVLKSLLFLLTRIKIEGQENLPSTGPMILAGNHVGSIETALMAAYSPRMVEFLAAGDLPLDPKTQFASNAYGFIPVNRGNLDLKSLRMAIDVLRQGGVLGIFPEGGIWEPGRMPAQLGVALLSQRGNAPIIPVGMSGIYGGLGQALKLKRPRMKVRFGKPIEPFLADHPVSGIREDMQQYADRVLAAIYELVDETDKALHPTQAAYNLRYTTSVGDDNASVREGLTGGDEFARMVMSDVILDSLLINLRLPIQTLYASDKPILKEDFLQALRAIQGYLTQNPGFLVYRYGHEVAELQTKAMRGLETLLLTHPTLRLFLTAAATFKDGHQEVTKRTYTIQEA